MQIKREQLVELGDAGAPIGVVFLGNSMTDAGVSPTDFLAVSQRYDDVYNAALVGAPVRSQAQWAEEVVLDEVDPDVVVLGLSPLDLVNTDGVLSNRLSVVEQGFDDTLDQLEPGWLSRVDEWSSRASAIVEHRAALRSPEGIGTAVWRTVTGATPVPRPEPQATVADGRRVPRNEEFWRQYMGNRGGTTQFHGRVLDPTERSGFLQGIGGLINEAQIEPALVGDVFETLDDHGVEVVIYIPPFATEVLTAAGADVARFTEGLEYIHELGAEHGAPVIDLFTGYPVEEFTDVAHLNEAGARHLSEDLARRLDALPPEQVGLDGDTGSD
jgi:hypothetical protein